MFRLTQQQWDVVKEKSNFFSKGSQSEVYKGQLLKQDVAIKLYHSSEEYLHELICLNNCESKYIVSVVGITPESLILDWYEYDLETFIETTPEYKVRLKILHDIIAGITTIHNIGYIHLDIRPKNILIKNNNAVICDFGCAIENKEPLKHIRKPDMWCAPEIQFDLKVSDKTDVYSFGLILWFLMDSNGAMPFPPSTTSDMIRAAFVQKERPKWKKMLFQKRNTEIKRMASIANECWKENQEIRPTAMKVWEQINNIITVASSN